MITAAGITLRRGKKIINHFLSFIQMAQKQGFLRFDGLNLNHIQENMVLHN